MIPINEIRVGIWTHNNVERRRLTKEDVAFLMTGDNAHYANPIPLTEEILLKSGFELFPWGWVKDGILILWNISKKNGFHVKMGNGKIIELPYVHSLQNLFSLLQHHLTVSL